jgi:hypothetical protein
MAAAERTPPASPPPNTRELARRVRATPHLSGSQKKYWLSILPHLRPQDRARLDAILRGDPAPDSGATEAPNTPERY